MAEDVTNHNTDEEDLSYLPEPPEEPLPSDCCGTGCSPCVQDIYHEELQGWLRLKAMTPRERAEWRKSNLKKPREEAVDSGTAVALSPSEYRTFAVERIVKLTADSFVFTFALPPELKLGLRAGQHAVLRVRGANGCPLTRQYTPITPLDQRGSFGVLIKLYDDGRMSEQVRQWQVGSAAEWRGPFGDFIYTPNKYNRIGMLACGTGIAPMIQIIRTVVENDEENAFLHLVYGCRSQDDILMKKELDEFASYWNFTVLYALSKATQQSFAENPGMISYGDKVHFGRVDSDLVHREMPSPSEGNIVLICGTKSFDKDMINHLRKAGYAKEMYFKF